jgi:hypothetical protein
MIVGSVAKQQLSRLLASIRAQVAEAGLQLDRLPPWVSAAQVRVGWIDDTVIAVFDPIAGAEDSWQIRRTVRSDVVLLLDTPDFAASTITLPAGQSPGPIVIAGSSDAGDGGTELTILGSRPAFLDCGFAGYHGIRAVYGVVIGLAPEEALGPLERRHVPSRYTHTNVTSP